MENVGMDTNFTQICQLFHWTFYISATRGSSSPIQHLFANIFWSRYLISVFFFFLKGLYSSLYSLCIHEALLLKSM